MIRPMCYYQMEMEEEEEEEEVHLSGQDLMRIRDAVALLVQTLLRLLQTFPLKDSPQTMIHCMQVPPGCICTPASFHTVEPAGLTANPFLFFFQIFSNLLYFEPTAGKPVFAAEQ